MSSRQSRPTTEIRQNYSDGPSRHRRISSVVAKEEEAKEGRRTRTASPKCVGHAIGAVVPISREIAKSGSVKLVVKVPRTLSVISHYPAA